MEKRRRWQVWVIAGVLALTLYNILPTLFFYAKPLDRPVTEKGAEKVASQIAQRVNSLESQSIAWLENFSKNLNIKPKGIEPVAGAPDYLRVTFGNEGEARRFKAYLPRGGALIPFIPAQLGVSQTAGAANEVIVQRRTGVHLDPQLFQYVAKEDSEGAPTPAWEGLVNERAAEIALAAGGESMPARLLRAAHGSEVAAKFELQTDQVLHLAEQIVDFERAFDGGPIASRFYRSFTQVSGGEKAPLVHTLIAQLEKASASFEKEIKAAEKGSSEGELAYRQNSALARRQKETVDTALAIVKGNSALFEQGENPLTRQQILTQLEQTGRVDLGNRNPFVAAIERDLEGDKLLVVLHPDVEAMRKLDTTSERGAYLTAKLDTLLLGEIGQIGHQASEQIAPDGFQFAAALSKLPGSKSLLVMDLSALAAEEGAHLQGALEALWQPTHPQFQQEHFPILSYAEYRTLSAEDQQLGLVVYAPAAEKGPLPEGFRNGSLYVIAKGIGDIAGATRSTSQVEALSTDTQHLYQLLSNAGFVGYPGNSFGIAPEFKEDFIFEMPGFAQMALAATREEFQIKGSGKRATLEFSNEKQRLIALNEIDTREHEDLLKWRDEYQAARVSMIPGARYEVPPPTRGVLADNLRLSAKKYFRGDANKVLNWGLDLSGGKSVTIGLRDSQGRPVTNPADLKQGVNELTRRVNKMGVSEVEVRTEGDNIVLNFPGAQGLSAKELVRASTLTFHIVNEKFSPHSPALGGSVSRFLQEVWNEAQVTGKTSIEEINEIAYNKLGGDLEEEGAVRPQSEAAKTLFQQGLRLANPRIGAPTSAFDDSLSMVAMFREDAAAEMQGEMTPLLITFYNYALDGPSLENVHGEYDPSRGNALVFSVASGTVRADGIRSNPRADLYAWTSQFAESRIGGTPKETATNGRGWRMAAVLNGEIVSAPTLKDSLRDNGNITGHFSQRQINQLVADLKAGSLTYTPKILSEKNVSPELGSEERAHGLVAAALGLVLVIACMSTYYRFAGMVASVAVLFNLLIMWGALQNIDAALTLPGIAAIILTMGMAVDANVLVFERVREEFAQSGKIALALSAGYKKAFTAIFDSNITTIIAAFILLHFDAGPIKGFAVTLIIGIVSSMFTALFMTRTFFASWVQNPKHTELKMRNFFKETRFDFLSKTRIAIIASIALMIAGAGMLYVERGSIFGMDFTGGYALNVSVEERAGVDYRQEALKALVAAGAPAKEVQVRELNRPTQLRIQLGTGLEQPGKPFAALPSEVPADQVVFPYQANSRITWVVDTLQAAGLTLKPDTLTRLTSEWSVISGQFSDTMRNQAIFGLGLALFAILVYITIRFEFKYAVSALVALTHDVVITIGAMAILHAMGLPVQIDLQVIGALMTIIGYSLNDTIIIFDRIREEGRLLRKLAYPDLINHSLNATLNRTIMTSLTTLLALIALVTFGGSAIFGFALVMTLGVVFGTFSSLFIACPTLLYFHSREARRENNAPSKA
ncbi:MAG: protein translocase subunit SecD [Parachlamydiales bacterium]